MIEKSILYHQIGAIVHFTQKLKSANLFDCFVENVENLPLLLEKVDKTPLEQEKNY